MDSHRYRVERLTAARQAGREKPAAPLTPLERIEMEIEAKRLLREEVEARQAAEEQGLHSNARFGSQSARLEALRQWRSDAAKSNID